MKKTILLLAVLSVALLFSAGCESPAGPDDPCEPTDGGEVDVTFDWYRQTVYNPSGNDAAGITGSIFDYISKPMTKVGKDHFQYTCRLPIKFRGEPYYVAVSDGKGNGQLTGKRIFANGVELTNMKYTGLGELAKFHINLCRVIP